jgi:hypothetical protein
VQALIALAAGLLAVAVAVLREQPPARDPRRARYKTASPKRPIRESAAA